MQEPQHSSREVEIKLLLRPQDVNRLKNHTYLWAGFEKAGAPSQQNSVYFDDRDQTLREHRVSLRIRHAGGRNMQTIKSLDGNGTPVDRAEWESEIKGSRPDLTAAAFTALAPLLEKKLRDPLEPVFETRVSRTSFVLQFGKSESIVALDQGEIDTGRNTAPINELELELKRGSSADLFRLAQEIDAAIPLELSYLSKSERGYALLNGGADFTKSEAVLLSKGLSRADSFRKIAHECLRHAIQNRAGVAKGDAASLHQVRIATRRLHTAMSLFKDVSGGRGANEVKTQLRWLRSETGPARDLDVFMSEVMAPIRAQHPREPAVTSLYRHLRRRRLKAAKTAREAIASRRFRNMIFHVAAWIEEGDWRTEADELRRARQDAPVELYAVDQLTMLRRKVKKRGKLLRQMSEVERHDLRVLTKKLRYAAEFFASLATTKKEIKRARTFIAAVRDFQDALGALNDITVRKSLTAEIAGQAKMQGTKLQVKAKASVTKASAASSTASSAADKDPARSRIFIAGLVAGHQDATVNGLMKKAVAAYEELVEAKPFWKNLVPELAIPASAILNGSGGQKPVPAFANQHSDTEETERKVA